MKRILLIALLGLTALVLSGCGVIGRSWSENVRGSGNVTTEERSVAPFTAIDISGLGKVEVKQGDVERLLVETDDNLQAIIRSEVRGDTLYLGFKPNVSAHTATRLVYTITVRDLEQITLSGDATINAHDLRGDELAVVNSGLGSITVDGAVEEQRVTLSGTGTYDASSLASERADITITGQGEAIVRVRERLDANLAGRGGIEYIGDPQVHKTISGLGEIRQRSVE